MKVPIYQLMNLPLFSFSWCFITDSCIASIDMFRMLCSLHNWCRLWIGKTIICILCQIGLLLRRQTIYSVIVQHTVILHTGLSLDEFCWCFRGTSNIGWELGLVTYSLRIMVKFATWTCSFFSYSCGSNLPCCQNYQMVCQHGHFIQVYQCFWS
jgi:hypothetical protein